ncbi:MAG: hypothetical protein KAJ10_10160 [Thermodesulfovibrionia bacterium]|nr:hypothetical protein [Thermodesulfovibrionia bacterium]
MKTVNNIQPKKGTETTDIYNADIKKNESIRIFGTYKNHVKGPQEFDKTFSIGQWAEYDSWNLKYNGEIVAIGEKTVTVEEYPGTHNAKRHRLSLHAFCRRNWNYSDEKIAAHNAEERMYI